VAWRRLDVPALIVYRDPGDDAISFGDIFESVHLIDIFVRSDASALGGGPMPRGAAEKVARQMNLELAGGDIAMYTPALKQRPEQWYVLGQGATMKLDAPIRAILLSDSCAVDKALGINRDGGGRTQGRLLFAPVVPATAAQLERLLDVPIFGRFPLRKEGSFAGAVAELARCFMVDVRDVEVKDRLLGLTEDAAEDLEVAWNAYALRRGPLVTEHNLAKLAAMLAGDASDAPDQDEAVEMIEQALFVAWRLEGGSLRAAADSPQLDADKLDQLVADLTELEEAARTAHERLSHARLT
jgi:hypothetical protein